MRTTNFAAQTLSKDEMKKVSGGNGGFCVPDDGTQPCIRVGGTMSCLIIPCCCDAVCGMEWNGSEFVGVCQGV